jgi:hypothetical protein
MSENYMVEMLVKDFLPTIDKPITGSDLIVAISKKMGLPDDEQYIVEDWLDDEFEETLEDFVIRSYDSATNEDVYQLRHNFYNGAQFLIKPLEFEIKQGVMIPGHRFYPFCSDQL